MTIEQARMKVADSCVEAIVAANQFEAAWSVLPGFGATVQRCGLLQALAFLQRPTVRQVGNIVSSRLGGHLREQGMIGGGNEELIQTVKQLSDASYMLATREVIALSVWLKRAAQAKKAARP